MLHGLGWWRRLGAALAAAALTVVTFGASLDALVCQDEPAAAAALHEAASAASGAEDRGQDPAGAEVCVHGHCHHGGAYAPPVLAAAPSSEHMALIADGLPRETVPTSDRQYGLMRPPRA